MLELAEQRNMEKEHEKQVIFSKMIAKREDQAKYRDVLDVQVNYVNSANGK
jgi:hypothetical protein